jgi:hypothetical protein
MRRKRMDFVEVEEEWLESGGRRVCADQTSSAGISSNE